MRKVFLAGVAVMVCVSAYAGPEWKFGEDGSLKASILGQVHYSFRDNAADEHDFYARRARLILQGQICDGIKVFVETDNDNLGRSGVDTSTDIQDAFVDFRLVKKDCVEAWLSTGLILLPFSLENKSSAASLLGTDYNAEAIKFVNSFVWRDLGAELHGNVFNKIAYRVGIFDGYDNYSTAAIEKNPDADMRITGHVTINVIGDVEKGGWFCAQNRLGKCNYLTVGAGLDSQQAATVSIVDETTGAVADEEDSGAFVFDVQSSFKACAQADVLLNGAYYDWDNALFKGNTAFVEAGVLSGKVMLTGKWMHTDSESADQVEDYTVGLHYFLKGHNARGGVEYRWGDSDDWVLAGLQFLL